jgi:hypothetical protein
VLNIVHQISEAVASVEMDFMNVENILKVADAIEQHSVPGLGFNMGWLTLSNQTMALEGVDKLRVADCGTVACIAGWASTLTDPLNPPSFGTAADFLEIDGLQRSHLFYATNHPEASGDAEDSGPLDEIEPDQAVRTLRNFAATGQVDWTA